MTVLERVDVTTPGTRRPDERYVLVAAGLLMPCLVGTNAGVVSPVDIAGVSITVTAGHGVLGTPLRRTTSQEVAAARNELVRRGLTRQQIARALGVDRRSLSGWVSGDIRPTPERLGVLRVLVDLAAAIDAMHPGRAAEILTRPRGGTDLLAQLALGHVDALENWQQWAAHPPARVTVTRSRAEGEPLWAAAVEAQRAGRLGRYERAPTVRSESEDQMDLQEAAAFAEPPPTEPRRQGYR